jgi:hypothetical protein
MLNALRQLFPPRSLLGIGETQRRWRPGTRRIPRNIELIPPPLRDVKDLKLQTPAIVAQANNVQVVLIRVLYTRRQSLKGGKVLAAVRSKENRV